MTEGSKRVNPVSWAYVVLALVLLLTALSAWFVNQLVEKQQRTRFLSEVDTVTQRIEQRLASYVSVMRAARSMWTVTGGVSRDDFARYVDTLDVQRDYSGLQGLGFAAYVRADERANFERTMREQGALNFRIWPEQAQRVFVPVTYLEPRDEANQYALGYDMHSELTRRNAIQRSIVDGDATATGRVFLVQEDRKQQRQAGFLIYLPVYKSNFSLRTINERRAALVGFIYVPVRVGDFLAGVGQNTRYGEIAIRVQDVVAGGDVVPLHGARDANAAFTNTKLLDVAGRQWKLEFTAPASFGRDNLVFTPWLTLLLGIGIASASFWAMQVQITGRRRAEEITERLTASRTSLAKSRAEFEAIFRAMHDTAVFADASGAVILSNDALGRTFGYTPQELQGRNLAELHADGTLARVENFESLVTQYRRRDGTHFYGEAQRSVVRDEAGEVIGQLEVVRDMTERLEAERALRESELRYRGVLEAMPQMVFVADPEGKHQYYNGGWYEYTGLTPEASRGYGFMNALHPDDVERTLHAWERTWRHGERYEIVYRFRRRDGVYHWFVGRASPIRNASGDIIEWVGTCTDIHDRVEMEGQLRRSGARYQALIESVPHVVWLADPAGNITYTNPRWSDYVGQDGSGNPFSPDLIHTADRQMFYDRWRDALAHAQPLQIDLRLRGANGDYRTFNARAVPVHGDEGEVIEWVGTLTDIEDQVYAELASRVLAEVSRLLSTPLGQQRDLSAALDRLTDRLAQSASVWLAREQTFDVTRSTRDAVNAAVLDAHREDAEAIATRVMQTRAPYVSSGTHDLHAAGLESTIAVPLIARAEAQLGALFLGFARAVEPRDFELAQEVASRIAIAIDNQRLFLQAREAERELTNLNMTLEHRVEARTHELQEANRELEAFSYSVSHDLRTPLRHIVGFGDLLRKDLEGQLGDKAQRYLGIITDAATRMSVLIDDLLSFSRMGRTELQLQWVSLTELAREVSAELTAETHGRVVTWDIHDMPSVPADPALLRLVFTNLLSNALKYSRTREVSHVGVTAHVQGDEVTVVVRDNGVGFDSRFADKLFGVFQRLHRAEEFEGTGIGLANVRRIVSRHGGRVWAESELGKGAAFYFTLPLERTAEPISKGNL